MCTIFRGWGGEVNFSSGITLNFTAEDPCSLLRTPSNQPSFNTVDLEIGADLTVTCHCQWCFPLSYLLLLSSTGLQSPCLLMPVLNQHHYPDAIYTAQHHSGRCYPQNCLPALPLLETLDDDTQLIWHCFSFPIRSYRLWEKNVSCWKMLSFSFLKIQIYVHRA